jgi:cell division protein FtsQ
LSIRVILLAALIALVGVTWLFPRVEQVEVLGHAHLDAASVAAAAGVAIGDPLLWVNRASVRRLASEPWVVRAEVVRDLPRRTVTIIVQERIPVAHVAGVALAEDGTALPGVDPADVAALPEIEGWGGERLAEALALLRILGGRGVEVITYTPAGFDVRLGASSLFTPSVEELQRWWSAYESQSGRRVAVYVWGVSSAP